MSSHVEARLNVYWRIGASKRIAKRYRKGWRPRHVQWDAAGERVIILWERSAAEACGVQPTGCDGTWTCELKPGHGGWHMDGGHRWE